MARVLRFLGNGLTFVLVIAGIIYGGLWYLAEPAETIGFYETVDDNTVLVIAHQGGAAERPSNTMEAFQHAANLGVDVLEMDVHSTRDDVLVLIHDDTVDRTTDCTGPVRDVTFEELQDCDAGYHFPTNNEQANIEERPYRGQGITIPSLKSVLQAFPDAAMMIEIKQQTPSIVQPLCDLLHEYKMTDQVVFATFHTTTMREFRQTCPTVATSHTESEIRPFYGLQLARLSHLWTPQGQSFQVPEYGGGLHILTPNFINAAKSRNVHVEAWTINTEDDMRHLIDIGIQGLITDYPTLALEIVNSHNE